LAELIQISGFLSVGGVLEDILSLCTNVYNAQLGDSKPALFMAAAENLDGLRDKFRSPKADNAAKSLNHASQLIEILPSLCKNLLVPATTFLNSN